MPALLYCGFSAEGRRVSGAEGFSTKSQMEEYLNNKQITSYEIFESKTTYKRGEYKLVSAKELSVFCKQMSVLFYSHIMLMEGVLILAEQAENKHLKLTLQEIHSFMERGYTFAETMRMYEHVFPSYLLNMIGIGETSGTLDDIFSRMSAYFDKEHKIRKSIRSAVTYPLVLTALMTAIIVLLITRILPIFGDILESMGAETPAAVRVILSGGSFLAAYAIPVIAAIAVIVFAFMFYINTEGGRLHFDRVKISIPAYRYVYSRIVTSRFARSLAILLKSGVQLINALEDVTVLTDNKYLEGRLAEAVKKVSAGGSPAESLFEIDIFPPLFEKLFFIGQKTGNLDEMLEKSASVFDEEADDAIKRFSDLLEPLLIIILSVIIGIILLSVILPMITIINSIG